MQIPIVFLLIPFGIVVLISTVFVMFNFFHVAHFGLQSTKTAIVLAVYLFGFSAVIILCYLILANFDWTQTIEITNIFYPKNWKF